MSKTKTKIYFPLSPTQEAFAKDPAPIIALIGPEGEGKTYAGLIAAIYHCANRMNGKPMYGAFIRDTHENIKNKSVFSINRAFEKLEERNPGMIQMPEWSDGAKLLHIPQFKITFNLFGANDISDLTRLQGADQWSFIWIDDPAPMFQRNNAGVPKYIMDAAIARAARGGEGMRVQVTANYSDEEFWMYDMFEKRPINRPPETPLLWSKVFHIPFGENPGRTDLQRQATKVAYKDDPALTRRLVEGAYAYAQEGEKVTPEYHDTVEGRPYHYTGKPIQVIPGAMGFRSWDGGHWPTCVIGQITPSGRLHFIHCFRGEHIGMKQLIETQVKPIIAMYYGKVTDWLDTGDPSLITGDDSDIEQSPARVIEKEFKTVYQGASHWPAVKEPMKTALNLTIDGKPYVQVGSGAEILHKALRGGWHYLTTNSGQVIRDKPVKDKHSHPGDCFGAICLKLLGQPIEKPEEENTQTAVTGPYAGL